LISRALTQRDYIASAVIAAKTATVVYGLIFLSFFWAFAEGDGTSAPRGMSVAGWIVAMLGFPLLAVPHSIVRAIESALPHSYYFVLLGAITIVWSLVAALLSVLWSKLAPTAAARSTTSKV
jgi:hypothetical protein